MKFNEIISAVETFHDSFGIQNHYELKSDLTSKEVQLRFDLMKEENEEYLEAALAGNRTEVADALGDQLYILCGTIITHGMQDLIEEVFREIHRSNLSKLGADGQPLYREDGKVMKGPNYFRPDIAAVLDGRSPQRSA